MPRSDYLMRIVQQFSKALAALLQRTTTLDREPTFEELDGLSTSFAGFDLVTLCSLDTDQILRLYSITGTLDVEKAYVSGVLLYRLARHDGDETTAQKALRVLSEVKREYGEPINEQHEALIEELERGLNGEA